MRIKKTRQWFIASSAGVLAMALSIAGCASEEPERRTVVAEILESGGVNELEGKSASELIDELDHMTVGQRPANMMASVRPNTLVLSDAQREAELPINSDEVYVSVAPYENRTHDCYFHSLTTCRGELGNQSIKVSLVAKDGRTLIDEDKRTFDNGFIGLWIPRGTNATLTIERDGKKAAREISTFGDDAQTCALYSDIITRNPVARSFEIKVSSHVNSLG